MNIERIEAEIKMFDRIELFFAIGAAAAAVVLVVLTVDRMKRNDVKPGRAALVLSAVVIAITGIYAGTVVFAGEEIIAEEGTIPGLHVAENSGAEEVLLEITGEILEGCFLKLAVTDADLFCEDDNKKETSAGMETGDCSDITGVDVTAEAAVGGAEKTSGCDEARDSGSEERTDESTVSEPEKMTDKTDESDTHVEEISDTEETVPADAEAVIETEEYAGEVIENQGDFETSDMNAEKPDGTQEKAACDICEISDPDENTGSSAGEIIIGLNTDPQYEDAEAEIVVLTEMAEAFDTSGVILKDVEVREGFIRAIVLGLKEAGSKCVKAGIVCGGVTQEIEFTLSMDMAAHAGEESMSCNEADFTGENNSENPQDQPDGEAAAIGDVYEEPGGENGSTDTYEEADNESGGADTSREGDNENGGADIYQKADNENGGGGIDEKYGNDAGVSDNEPDAANVTVQRSGADASGDGQKISKAEEPPVIILRPYNEGSGFKVSADTEAAINNVYISDAKEIRIIETNAEEVKKAEIVYTVNGETYPMEYGTDYSIEKTNTDEGWQYEYVVAPQVFEKDGYYNINITSKDRSGNISNNKTAGTGVSFVIDRTPPSIIVTNLDDGGVYKEGGHEYKVTVKDNTLLKYFRIYENKELKAEYFYDREKWINVQDKADMLSAPGGTVTLMTEASGETKTMEFEAEDESGNICRSGSYTIYDGKNRSSMAGPFAVTAGLLTLVIILVIKYSGLKKTYVRRNQSGSERRRNGY